MLSHDIYSTFVGINLSIIYLLLQVKDAQRCSPRTILLNHSQHGDEADFFFTFVSIFLVKVSKTKASQHVLIYQLIKRTEFKK